jgi:hypothetical protein
MRFDGGPVPEGPASLERSVSGGPGAEREGVGVVVVLGASGPWGQPSGPMEMRGIWRITGAPMGPATTKMRRSSSSSSPPTSSP